MRSSRPAAVIALAVLLLALAALAWRSVRESGGSGEDGRELVLLAAAAFREPLEAIIAAWEASPTSPGQPRRPRIHLRLGGSGELLAQAKLGGGDLYLPADQTFVEAARRLGLVEESRPVARLTAGLLTPPGNPLGLASLDDLLRPGIRVGIGSPSASIGRFTREQLERTGHWERLEPRVAAVSPTVAGVAANVALGAVDVGIVWDVVAVSAFPDLAFVRVAEFEAVPSTAELVVLTCSDDAEAARAFVGFATDPAGGGRILAQHGFPAPSKARPPGAGAPGGEGS